MGRPAAALLILASCAAKVDFAESAFLCGPAGECPEGTTCQTGRCLPSAGDPADAGADPSVDARPSGSDLTGPDAAVPRCGDGVVRFPVESCDDGNELDGDACPATCRTCEGIARGASCYTFHDLGAGWEGASADCLARGGHLATVADADEEVVVEATAQTAAWIGLSDLVTEGTFVWVTEEPLGFTAWLVGEPNDLNGAEDCGQTWFAGGWNDNACAAPYPHVCEDDGWAVRAEDGHAYRVVWTPSDRQGGESACARLGGHLVTIGSAEEQAFVAPLATTALRLGLSEEGTEGSFVWGTGEPLGYTSWRTGEPDDVPPGSDCAVLVPGGTWEDAGCGAAVPALCEVE